MSSTSAAVTAAAPATSKHRGQPASVLSGSNGRLNASTARPTGMLMKKTPGQPNAAVTGPPSSSPAVAPTPPIPPQQVGAAAAEQQQAAEAQQVGAHHPLHAAG